MSDYNNFTSLPPDEERTFVVYERLSVENSKKAMTIGMIAGGVFFLITLLVVFSHSKPKESKIKKEDIQTSTTEASAPDETETAPDTKKDDEAEDDEGDDDDDDDDDAKDKADDKDKDAKKDGDKDAKKDGDGKDDAKKDEGKKDKKK